MQINGRLHKCNDCTSVARMKLLDLGELVLNGSNPTHPRLINILPNRNKRVTTSSRKRQSNVQENR